MKLGKIVNFAISKARFNGIITPEVLQDTLQKFIDSGSLTGLIQIYITKEKAKDDTDYISVGWTPSTLSELVGRLELAKSIVIDDEE